MSNYDCGAIEAARHGTVRSSHWPIVEKAFKLAHPWCEACGTGIKRQIQVHHINPFHYVIALGRPDLELDPRNLTSLCETTHEIPAPNHHLLIGHLDNFKEANLDVLHDATKVYFGMDANAIKASPGWQNEEHAGRLKALDVMSAEEKHAYRIKLDRELPPDLALIKRFKVK